jgi:hypothetical protein
MKIWGCFSYREGEAIDPRHVGFPRNTTDKSVASLRSFGHLALLPQLISQKEFFHGKWSYKPASMFQMKRKSTLPQISITAVWIYFQYPYFSTKYKTYKKMLKGGVLADGKFAY